MSRQFSQTTTPYRGIIQEIETTIYGNDGLGRITGNSTQLGLWTSRINDALDDLHARIFQVDGRWQFDDSNHTDYPIIYTNLVDGQRDYSFTTDENSNLILDIQRVAILQSASDTEYEEIYPVDQQTSGEGYNIMSENSDEGTPYSYDKTANGIFLDPTPSYNATNGLKVYISREGSYFTASDTTKKAGVDGRLHLYLALKPALDYAIKNTLGNVNGLAKQVNDMQNLINEIYGKRQEDEQSTLSTRRINHR